jgi:predicted O-methyltransferase YrrM
MNLAKSLRMGWAAAGAVIAGGNLAALSLINRPSRAIRCCSESLFIYKAISRRGRLTEKRLIDILPVGSVTDISLGNVRAGFGWFREEGSYMVDLVNLCLICRTLQPKMIFEIGTFNGYSAYEFALNSGPDTHVYSLDLPPDGAASLTTTASDDSIIDGRLEERCAFEDRPEAQRIHLLFGDSAHFDFQPFHGKVDLFFIDGAHSYDYVKSDTMNAIKCCHSGSVLVWHDFGRTGVNGVSRWLRELSSTRQIYSLVGGSLAVTMF